jgi:F-type H+-transporting ATPase subunit b
MKRLRSLLIPVGAALLLALASPVLRAQEAPEHPAAAAEAAGKEAPAKEEAEHHAEVTLFGHVLDNKAKFGVQMFNFALFVGILVVLLRSALASAFKARSRELEEKLSQAERDRQEAAAQVQELETRMAGLQQELEGIMAKAEADAVQEKERILESARQESAQILAQTQNEILFQQRQAEDELRALVATLAVEGATKRLESRLQGPEAVQVLDRAITQVGGSK